jgi:hypothetical protein
MDTEKFLKQICPKEIQDLENEWVFIWGLKSYDDLSPSEANLYTMNDLEITYNKKDNKYYIGIETIYLFEDGIEGLKRYINRLFNALTAWMKSKGFDTQNPSTLRKVSANINDIGKEPYDTIEELYADFKFIVDDLFKVG